MSSQISAVTLTSDNLLGSFQEADHRFGIGSVVECVAEELIDWSASEHERLGRALKGDFGITTDAAFTVAALVREKDVLRRISVMAPSNCATEPQINGLVNSVRTNADNDEMRLTVILDGVKKDDNLEELVQSAKEAGNVNILMTNRCVGYMAAISAGLSVASSSEFTGFIDDDSVPLLGAEHFEILGNSLARNTDLFAIGGLAQDYGRFDDILHGFFNLPNSYDFFNEALKAGIDLTKPHVHGGGGATLMRTQDFADCLSFARTHKVLLGPSISAIGRSQGRETLARADMPVIHPTKSKLLDWVIMVRKYYATWGMFHELLDINTRPYREGYLQNEAKAVQLRPESFQNQYNALNFIRRSLK